MLPPMSTAQTTEVVLRLTEMGVYWFIAIFAVAGAVMVLTTRDDAFTAGDRHPKMVWFAMLAGSAFALAIGLPFLAWIGAVVTGIYWFDVRPQLRSIINGDYFY